MDNGEPGQRTATEAQRKTGLIGWLSNANNLVTTIGTIVAAIAAIFSTINKVRIDSITQHLDVKSKEFDFDQKKAKAINDFAGLFLEKVLGDPSLKNSAKHNQALLSITNLVAQASGGVKDLDAAARAVMPLHLALMFNEPGALTAIDADGKHLDDWVALACADNSEQTRLTAVQALEGICQRALREQKLDVLWNGIRAMDQLIAFIPLDQVATRGTAIACRAQLASSIQRDSEDFGTAHLDKGLAEDEAAKDIRKQIADRNEKATDELLATQDTIGAKARELDSAKKPEDKTQVAELNKAQVQLDTAQAALQVTRQRQLAHTAAPTLDVPAEGPPPNFFQRLFGSRRKLDTPAEGPASPGPQSSGPSSQTTVVDQTSASATADERALNALIANMSDDDDSKRHRARSDAALFGQKAVKRLISEIEKRYGNNEEKDAKTRLGVADALRLMRQPIELDEQDAYWVASLLTVPDAETRKSAAEFMIKLESGTSVGNCYDALESLFYTWFKAPDKGGNAIINAATIVATWARVVTPETPSRDPNKPFPKFALEQAQTWKETLKGSNPTGWKLAIHTLDDLISRAKSKNRTPS